MDFTGLYTAKDDNYVTIIIKADGPILQNWQLIFMLTLSPETRVRTADYIVLCLVRISQ